MVQASPKRGACSFAMLVVTLLLPANGSLHAQAGAESLTIPLVVSNNHGNNTSLRIGLHAMATNGIDESLGERKLPPLPPAEIYDVRLIGPEPDILLGEGSLYDLRPWRNGAAIFSEQYRILFQAGGNWPSVTVLLPASLPREITRLRIDGKSLTAGDSAVSLLPSATMDIMVEFDLTPPTVIVSPSSLVFPVSESDTALPPARNVRITPSIVDGSWSASASEGWISLDRTVGTGESDLNVGISRITFADGRSSGIVEIHIAGNDEPAVITVHVDMTTAVQAVDAPETCSLRSVSPQPVDAGRMVLVEYATGVPGPVTLTVIDILGRVCATPMREAFHYPGVQTLRFSTAASRLAPGIYFLRLVAGQTIRISPLIVK
jgi:hypothetical protein